MGDREVDAERWNEQTMMLRLPAISPLVAALAAIVAVLLLADVVVAIQLVAHHSAAPVANTTSDTPKSSKSSQTASSHPCNHGYYVSQAAHAKKGGGYVSGIAQSGLGKDGKCSAPLPAQAPKTP